MVHFNEIPPTNKGGHTIGSSSIEAGNTENIRLSKEQADNLKKLRALLKFAKGNGNNNTEVSPNLLSKLEMFNMEQQIKSTDAKAKEKLSPKEYKEYKEIQGKANSKSYDAEAIRNWNEKHPDLKIVSQYNNFIYGD